MKKLAATASALALLGTGAYAQSTDTVTLNATVGDYIAITDSQGSTIGDLNIATGSGDGANNNVNNNGAGDEKATFTVTANVDYDIALAWETWIDAGVGDPTPGYAQANYYNSVAGCSIGGAVHFDETPGQDGTGVSYPSGGANPWTVGTAYAPGMDVVYGIGTSASPDITDCTNDVAAPGTYSLDVAITVSAS
ncbi:MULTISPECIES: hypothetical protein [unclassified Rhodosalinus]|uniref:hypothetical protein n=1 Tax=unclassified Rhodosalinus TaxID=2630183 RepID=UPI0035259FFC